MPAIRMTTLILIMVLMMMAMIDDYQKPDILRKSSQSPPKNWSVFARLDLTMGGQDCNTQSAVNINHQNIWSEKLNLDKEQHSQPDFILEENIIYFSLKYFMQITLQSGVYTNTVVVQRHSVVMTKTDKIYKVINPQQNSY